MEDNLIYKEMQQLIKDIRTKPDCEYHFAMPEWFVEEHKDWFEFRNNETYFHGGKVFIYPNEFKG